MDFISRPFGEGLIMPVLPVVVVATAKPPAGDENNGVAGNITAGKYST